MPYLVRANNPPWPGRWRDGRFFLNTADTLLQDDELTPGMREDARLTITAVEVPGEPLVGAPADLPELPPLAGDEPYVEGEADAPAGDGPTRCTGAKVDGSPCGAWAVEGSDRCWRHPREE